MVDVWGNLVEASDDLSFADVPDERSVTRRCSGDAVQVSFKHKTREESTSLNVLTQTAETQNVCVPEQNVLNERFNERSLRQEELRMWKGWNHTPTAFTFLR